MKSYSAGSSRLGRCSSSRMSSLSLSGVLTGGTVAKGRRDCQAEKENHPFGWFALLRSLRLKFKLGGRPTRLPDTPLARTEARAERRRFAYRRPRSSGARGSRRTPRMPCRNSCLPPPRRIELRASLGPTLVGRGGVKTDLADRLDPERRQLPHAGGITGHERRICALVGVEIEVACERAPEGRIAILAIEGDDVLDVLLACDHLLTCGHLRVLSLSGRCGRNCSKGKSDRQARAARGERRRDFHPAASPPRACARNSRRRRSRCCASSPCRGPRRPPCKRRDDSSRRVKSSRRRHHRRGSGSRWDSCGRASTCDPSRKKG